MSSRPAQLTENAGAPSPHRRTFFARRLRRDIDSFFWFFVGREKRHLSAYCTGGVTYFPPFTHNASTLSSA